MPFDPELAMRLIDEAVLKVIEASAGPDGLARINANEIAAQVRRERKAVLRATKRLENTYIEKIGATRGMVYRVLKRADGR